MNSVTVPEKIQNFDEPPFLGSFQQLLSNNVGRSVRIDYLIGSAGVISQTGVIEAVGLSYTLLRQPNRRAVVAGDNYSIKFVTFLD